jgi:hypothetical protein
MNALQQQEVGVITNTDHWVSLLLGVFDFGDNGGDMFGLDPILDQLDHGCQHVLVHSALHQVRNIEHLVQRLSIVDYIALSRTPRQIVHHLLFKLLSIKPNLNKYVTHIY